MDPRLHRERLVVAQADLRQGPARPGPPGRAVLPALRHRPVRPRARPGLRDRRRPVGLRPLPAHERPARRARRRAAGLDDHAVDAGLQHRRRRQPRRRPTSSPAPAGRRAARRRRAAASRPSSARTPRSSTGCPAPTLEHVDLRPAVRPGRHPRTRTSSCSPTTSRPRTAPAWSTRRPRSAPTTSRSARRYGLPVVNPVRPDGHFAADVPLVGGAVLQEGRRDARRRPAGPRPAVPARAATSTPTRTAGAATRRCSTTRSRPGTSAPPRSRTRCSRENDATNWYPPTIKPGRYGDWLDNNIDWALSRNRYWGTPLPIWRCADEPPDRRRLARRARRARRHATCPTLDPHRPYVDDVTFACPTCGQPARRVPEVIDAWYDSGSMPFAQWGYPHHNAEEFERGLPGAVHLRGDRPDPRLVLHADGHRHAGLRPVVVRERGLPRATSSTRTAAR